MNNGKPNKRYMSDINVTPLVDVMLVLLIIFMATAPMMMQGVEVNLPQTTTKKIKFQGEPLILTVNKKREIYLEDHKMGIEDLERKLKTIYKHRMEKEVFLKADREISFGFVMKVIAGVKRAGIVNLGLITEPID
jgi:biopolymer transport protein TolR